LLLVLITLCASSLTQVCFVLIMDHLRSPE
jgi:hypothetical protein